MDKTTITLIIIIGAIILVLIVAILKGIWLSHHKFICSECNRVFYPKWYQVMFETHFGDKFRIKCPHCGKKKYHRCIE